MQIKIMSVNFSFYPLIFLIIKSKSKMPKNNENIALMLITNSIKENGESSSKY